MENIVIKNAEKEDAHGILNVQHKTWLSTYPNEKIGITVDDIEDRFTSRFSDEGLLKREKSIENLAPNEKYLVAKDGDKIVGMCFAKILETKNQLQAIYILPEYQGLGLGFKLWNEVLAFFDKTKDIYVEVADYNEKAIAFYKKLGFEETGRRFSDENFRMKSGALLPEMEMIIKSEEIA